MAQYTFQTNVNPLVNAWRVNCAASVVPERQCNVMVKSKGGRSRESRVRHHLCPHKLCNLGQVA